MVRLQRKHMTILRSLLFVPGNTPRMLDRALVLRPDAFVPDLEDSVPSDEKSNARSVTASYLERLAATGRPVIPRVNSMDTGLLEEDLAAMVGPHIFGVSVGKIDSPADVDEVARLLQRLELKAGLPIGAVKMVPWIESARAIVNVYDICASNDRIVAVSLGGEDYTNDMEIERRDDARELARGGVASQPAAVGVGRVAAELGQLQRPGVQREDVTGAMGDQYGMIGADGVEVLSSEETHLGRLGVVVLVQRIRSCSLTGYSATPCSRRSCNG